MNALPDELEPERGAIADLHDRYARILHTLDALEPMLVALSAEINATYEQTYALVRRAIERNPGGEPGIEDAIHDLTLYQRTALHRLAPGVEALTENR